MAVTIIKASEEGTGNPSLDRKQGINPTNLQKKGKNRKTKGISVNIGECR